MKSEDNELSEFLKIPKWFFLIFCGLFILSIILSFGMVVLVAIGAIIEAFFPTYVSAFIMALIVFYAGVLMYKFFVKKLNIRKKFQKEALLIISALFLISAAINFFYNKSQHYIYETFHKTEAVVIALNIHKDKRVRCDGKKDYCYHYIPNIKFTYKVDEVAYESERFSMVDNLLHQNGSPTFFINAPDSILAVGAFKDAPKRSRERDIKKLEKFKEDYKVGSRHTAYYDPDNPESSALSMEEPYYFIFYLKLFLGLLFLIYGLKNGLIKCKK